MGSRAILAGVRIGIFGKGGAGKSTLTVVLAQELQRQGYLVCVIDADSTNYGLAEALGMKPPENSLLDFFGGMAFSGGKVTCPVDDPVLLANAEISIRDLAPRYYAKNGQGITLFTAGKISRLGPGAGCDGPVAKIAQDFSMRLEGREPVTLIDFKAGFEDSARGVLTTLDYALVVVDPTTAAVGLAGDFRDMIEEIKKDVLPATAHLECPELVELVNRLFKDAPIQEMFCVLNRIPDQKSEVYLRERLGRKGLKPIASIPQEQDIQAGWLKGILIQGNGFREEVVKIVATLENSLVERKGELA